MAKIELTDFVRYGELFEIYGKLLSQDRQKIMRQYFDFNMTLAEISKEKQISRQAVLDSISKACQKLDEYENTLHLLERKNKLIKILSDLKNKDSLKEIKQKVDEILGDI